MIVYPTYIKIKRDDYMAEFIGQLGDFQFFLTKPFVPQHNGPTEDFIALYIFDMKGRIASARIERLGFRGDRDEERAKAIEESFMEMIKDGIYCDIEIKPFWLSIYGVEFGLIIHDPEEDGDDYTVTVEPGNYMCFNPPWNGEYDT